MRLGAGDNAVIRWLRLLSRRPRDLEEACAWGVDRVRWRSTEVPDDIHDKVAISHMQGIAHECIRDKGTDVARFADCRGQLVGARQARVLLFEATLMKWSDKKEFKTLDSTNESK